MKRIKQKDSYTSTDYWLVRNRLDYIENSKEYKLALLIKEMIIEEIDDRSREE